MSIAGGLPLAIARAQIHGCETLQIFSKNASQWRARPLPASEISEFRDAAKKAAIAPIVAHASYLINLATTSDTLRAQSIAALGEEVDRAEALGLLGVVLHPGARMAAPVDQALSLISSALTQVLKSRPRGKTMILIEHTAGQGSTMGASFEEVAAMIDGVKNSKRLGVCLDTCHLLASGYNLCTEDGYNATFATFDALIGFDRLKVFHLNDSAADGFALRSFADDSGDGKERMAGEGQSRRRSARRDESEYSSQLDEITRVRATRNALQKEFSYSRALVSGVRFPEYFRLEFEQLCALLKGVSRQPRFGACLRGELDRVPFPFNGDLRQQQAAAAAEFHNESVPADDDLVQIGDAFDRPKHRELEIDVGPLGVAQRRKSRIR
jgi:deoxyribonuclease-4